MPLVLTEKQIKQVEKNKRYLETLEDRHLECFINILFSWDKTRQGIDYWVKWCDFCHKQFNNGGHHPVRLPEPTHKNAFLLVGDEWLTIYWQHILRYFKRLNMDHALKSRLSYDIDSAYKVIPERKYPI